MSPPPGQVNGASKADLGLDSQIILPEPYKCLVVVSGDVWTGEKNGSVIVRNSRTGDKIGLVHEPTKGYCSSISLLESSKQVWCGFSDGYLRVYDSGTKQKLAETHPHSGFVSAVVTTLDKVFTGGTDWRVYQWCFTNGSLNQLSVFSGHKNSIKSLSAHSNPTCNYLFSGSDDSTIRVWDTTLRGQVSSCCSVLSGQNTPILALCSPLTTQTLWSGGEDGSLCVWNVAGTTQQYQLKHRLRSLHVVAVAQMMNLPNGKLWTCDKHGVILLWNPTEEHLVQKLSPSDGGSWQRNAILCSAPLPIRIQYPVWTCSGDGTVRIWVCEANDTDRAEHVQSLESHISFLKESSNEEMKRIKDVYEDDIKKLGERLTDLTSKLAEKQQVIEAIPTQMQKLRQTYEEDFAKNIPPPRPPTTPTASKVVQSVAVVMSPCPDLPAPIPAPQAIPPVPHAFLQEDDIRSFLKQKKLQLTTEHQIALNEKDKQLAHTIEALHTSEEHRNVLEQEVQSLKLALETTNRHLEGLRRTEETEDKMLIHEIKALQSKMTEMSVKCADRDNLVLQVNSLTKELERTVQNKVSNEILSERVSELETLLEIQKTESEKSLLELRTNMLETASQFGADKEALEASEKHTSALLRETSIKLVDAETLLLKEKDCSESLRAELSASQEIITSLTVESESLKGPWLQLQEVLTASQETLATVQGQFKKDIASLEADLQNKNIEVVTLRKALLEKDAQLSSLSTRTDIAF
eukprot:TRINITY_DN699_c0_g1_i2.p1 TRINITY_DN699_c0_g1~~TRINITY_DN699_c0_g1_i2.p1  ORF type:complete len:748 (+),score=162.37 TRINITY_DN699_c0_g1_i2:2123-4366(+)